MLELSLTNAPPIGHQEETVFDPALPFQPEAGLHVHLVKFDPLVADGASIGWNYLSGVTTEDQGEDQGDDGDDGDSPYGCELHCDPPPP